VFALSQVLAGLDTCAVAWSECAGLRRLGDGKISMDEGYRKHRELLKRQHFGREPPTRRSMF